MSSRIIIVVVLVALAIGVTGCEKLAGVTVFDNQVVTQEATVAAPAAAVKGQVPEGVPDVLPLWPGATVSSGEVAEGSIVLSLGTKATYSDVVAGTSVGFERAGWTVSEGAEESSATVLDVAGKGYEGVVTITETDSGAVIDYVIAESTD